MGHLRANGFKVDALDVSNQELDAVKKQYGVSDELAGCHTGSVEGYVVEGHVPAEDLRRLLEERPEIIGLSVPGMPLGSPGMEAPAGGEETYEVLSFDRQGNVEVFARH